GRVGHEDHAVHATQDELARGVVEDLPGHSVEVEARLEAVHLAEVEGQEVEEQRALVLGSEGDHLTLRLGRHLLVDLLQVRRLARQAGPVVDDLEVDLPDREVDRAHRSLVPKSPSSSAAVESDHSLSNSTTGGASWEFSMTARISAAASFVAIFTLPSWALLSKTVTSRASSPSSSR